MTYLVLPRASANRVYGAGAASLLGAELVFLDRCLGHGTVGDHRVVDIGGVEYVELDTGGRDLGDDEVAVLANGSGVHALFRSRGALLEPLPVRPLRRQDDDIVSIQRYSGKTNEQFTRLLVNVTLAAAGDAFPRLLRGDRAALVDPLAGRGTTLNQAVVYGLDGYGVERSRRDLEAYEAFVLRWLKDKRIKHRVERATVRRGREGAARLATITYGYSRDDPSGGRVLRLVNDDTSRAGDHLRRGAADVVVADLPYGVQHRAHAGDRSARAPGALLRDAVPAWARLLRPGGALGLAWNLRTLPREEVVVALGEAGLAPARDPDGGAFVHHVDRSITRDLVVASPRPGAG